MKKKLLALLATFFLQTPAFANPYEVTVLTKGNLLVYLYGDTHCEYSARLQSIDLSIAQNRNRPGQLRRRWVMHRRARLLENDSDVVARKLSLSITRLVQAGEDVTVLLEQYLHLSAGILDGFEALCNIRRPNFTHSRLCPSCTATVHKKAQEAARVYVRRMRASKMFFERITQEVAETIPVICVDTYRKRVIAVHGYMKLLKLLSDFAIVGIDTEAVEKEIYKEIEKLRPQDIDFMSGGALWYEQIATKFREHREQMVEHCRKSEDVLGENMWCQRVRKGLIDSLLNPFRKLTFLENEAMEKILAQETTQMPKKIVLFAGSAHTRRLTDMLKDKGFRVWYAYSEDRAYATDEEKYRAARRFRQREENITILDTPILEGIASRPRAPAQPQEL